MVPARALASVQASSSVRDAGQGKTFRRVAGVEIGLTAPILRLGQELHHEAAGPPASLPSPVTLWATASRTTVGICSD